MTLDAINSDLEKKFNEYDKQVNDYYEKAQIARINQIENKWTTTSIFSLLPWIGITFAFASNMPEVANVIPVEAIPFITLAGSYGIGSIGNKLLLKCFGLTNPLSTARTDKDFFTEEIQNKIKSEQALNRKLIMDKAMDFLDDSECVEDDYSAKSDYVLSPEKIEKKYELLDLLSARKIIMEEYNAKKKEENDSKTFSDSVLVGLLSMCYGNMPFVWSNQWSGYGGNLVTVLSPLVAGSLGTGAYILKKRKDREDVFLQFDSAFPKIDEPMDIDGLITELAKDEVKIRKSKLFMGSDKGSTVYCKENHTQN